MDRRDIIVELIWRQHRRPRDRQGSRKGRGNVGGQDTDPNRCLDGLAGRIDGRQFDHGSAEGLDEGETAAIALAILLGADLLLMDERKGVTVARGMGLRVTGTLGVLDIAAQRGLVDFAQAADRLRRTSFRISGALLDSLLRKHAQGGGNV